MSGAFRKTQIERDKILVGGVLFLGYVARLTLPNGLRIFGERRQARGAKESIPIIEFSISVTQSAVSSYILPKYTEWTGSAIRTAAPEII